MKKVNGHLIYILFILFFSILGVKALFHPGLFTAHDIWHQVVRLYYYYQAVNDGQFLPLWIGQLANGFGYPLFFFSYHLPWLIGVPFLKAGLDIAETIKLLFFISFVGSGLSMYFFVHSLLKSKVAAFLSSVLYLWLPYHFLTIFVSASMGIAFVFAFLPLIFLGIHFIKERINLGIPVLALGTSGVILSHIMHLIFLLPFVLIFLLWELTSTTNKRKFLINIAGGTVLSIVLSSFYLLPAFFYNESTRVAQETGFSTLYQRNFINLSQLIYSKWGYSPIINNAKAGEISFQLGIAQWISFLLLVALILSGRLKKAYKILGIYLVIMIVTSIFLMLDYSKPVWELLVKYVVVDYPFRLLLPASFAGSLVAGLIYVNLTKRWAIIFLLTIIPVALYTNRNHINVNEYTNFPVSTYLNIETEKTTNTFNEYLPRGAEGKLLNTPWNEVAGENLTASGTIQKTNSLSFDIEVKKETTASAGQFNFPGQKLYIDEALVATNTDKAERIAFRVLPGKHRVEIKYEQTQLIKVSRYLSLIGIAVLFLMIIKGIPPLRKKGASD